MITKRVLAIALAGAMCLAVPAAYAGVTVKGVDTSSFPVLRVSVLTSDPSSQPPGLRERPARPDRAGGEPWRREVRRARDRPFTVDARRSARQRGRGSTGFLASKPAADRLAVASFATKPQILTDFSTQRSDLDGALSAIEVDPVQGTTLYDAIVRASNTLASEPLEARVIIAVTDGNETRSSASLNEAISAAQSQDGDLRRRHREPKFNPTLSASSPSRPVARTTEPRRAQP